MTLHAVFQVGPTLNYCEWLRINVDVKVLQPCISTEAMRNPSHSSLVIYTAGPGSQTISRLHDHQKRGQMFIISLWILYSVSPSSSSFLWFSLQGLYCFHLSSDTVHYVNYVEPRARQSLQGGFIWLECEEMANSCPLASLLQISESWVLSSISVSIIFYFGQNVSAPLTRWKSSLTHKSIHASSLLKSFHDLNLFFFFNLAFNCETESQENSQEGLCM